LSHSQGFAEERSYEILGVLLLCLTTVLFLALVTDGYASTGEGARPVDGMSSVPNLLGAPGAIIAGVLALLLGDARHVLYGVTFIWGFMLLTHRPLDRMISRTLGLVVLTGAVAGILQMSMSSGASNGQAGGIFGAFVMDALLPNFGLLGSNILCVFPLLMGILLTTDLIAVQACLLLFHVAARLFGGGAYVYRGAVDFWDRMTADEDDEDPPFPEAPPAELIRRANREERRARTTARTRPEAEAQDLPFDAPIQEEQFHEPGHVLEPAAEAPFEPEREAAPMPLPSEAPTRRIRIAAAAEPAPELEPAFEPAAHAPFDEPSAVEVEVEYEDEPAPAPTSAPVAARGKTAARTRAGQLDLPYNAGSGEPLRTVAKPRRKVNDFDEIPPDYVYPKHYTKPPLDMLDKPEPRAIPNLHEQLQDTSVLLEETLMTFNIEARVTDVTRGPTITRFELEPAPGVKVSRFLSLADDIALALKAHRVRVEAPIPGKGRVGIEVPNVERDAVVLRELLESRVFTGTKGKLPLCLGKDIAGVVQVADLCGMPHLLVAGATGAGKTVCVKSILASLLFTHTPDELQMILIDPKMVELSVFNDIPHLITPVVTDPKKASTALTWLIKEMEERYKLFADLRVRNIEVYNKSVENGEIEMEGGHQGPVDVIRKLPYIVCVVDELADLMMLARAEVEDSIARLAQLARAVGIHLIIATQRPSVDVLTGVIKANFPARISFQVSSRVDSRCILDEIGAEKLIGQGDLLYLPAGQSKPVRIQGAFVSDEEMFSLIAYLKRQAPPQYRDEIENFGRNQDKLAELGDEDDPLFDEAVQVVLETGQASISMVQRRLRVGYTRAARLIDMMELRGIVGPHEGSKAREILVDTVSREDVA
jgi:DNA segregation ATPase FtsK/SpoIIIE-like protein